MKLDERHSRPPCEPDERTPTFLHTMASTTTTNGDGPNALLVPYQSVHLTPRERSRSRVRSRVADAGANDYRERLDRTENSTESDDGVRLKRSSTSKVTSSSHGEQPQGKMVLNAEVDLLVDSVFNLIFIHDQFMVDVYSVRKVTDMLVTPWEDQDEGRRCRQMTYNMSLSISSIGSKVASVTERQVVLESQPGKRYVVETESTNSGIPYADAFTVVNHYCLTQGAEGRTNLSVWCHVKYRKTIWGIVKGMLEKNTHNGVEALMTEIVSQLVTEADRLAPAMGRRRRRAQTPGDRARTHGHKHASSKGYRAPSRPQPSTAWVGVAVAAAVVVLALGNAILYSRLSHLEQQARHSHAHTALPEDRWTGMPASWEAVARILQRQEVLHHQHLKQWKTRIEEASLKLKEVQDSLELLLATIPEDQQSLTMAFQQQSDFFEKLENSRDTTEELLQHLVQENSESQS
ncbi:uncharacterized protein [Panulirus ornatus]|uniref:uncharacterized protein n=1 Tax=Panulirus ornatus TaxID=150431 RepID=UPI003A8A840D